MKNMIHTLALLFAFFIGAPLVSAGPILSVDGSLLTGLDVNGTLYDVEFLDGIVSEVFPKHLVTAPGWYEMVGDLTAALYDALLNMGINDNKAFRGCNDNPGIPGFIGPDVCMIITPDKYEFSDPYEIWRADNIVVVNSNGTFYTPPPYGAGLLGTDDTASAVIADFVTLARFSTSQGSISEPGSMLLTLSALFLIAVRATAARKVSE